MTVRSWPDVPEKHRWALELMEERLEQTKLSPEALRTRADELRAEAASTEITGFRDAVLTLADHYTEAAAARLASA